MRRSERSNGSRLGGGDAARETPGLFQFRLVDRLQCQQSGTVKYTTQAADNLLSLQVRRSACSVRSARRTLCCFFWCGVRVVSCRVVSDGSARLHGPILFIVFIPKRQGSLCDNMRVIDY